MPVKGKKLKLHHATYQAESRFDRQERIAWWRQDQIAKARILVVGAGAIGNEVLKNLALLGFCQVGIVDMDTVSTSNLSRTVLFGPADLGRYKAEVAAKRFQAMSLATDVDVEFFIGDVVWELGVGVYRSYDLVLACLDNIETRFAVNQRCFQAGVPWIDSGIAALGLRINMYIPPNGPCYACHATEAQLKSMRERYSCDSFIRKAVDIQIVPTTQIAAAIVGGFQVQEAVKYLAGQPVIAGKQIYYQGYSHAFEENTKRIDPNCGIHDAYQAVDFLAPFDTRNTIRELLEYVQAQQGLQNCPSLDIRGENWTFVASSPCLHCNRPIKMDRPNFKITSDESICGECLPEDGRLSAAAPELIAEFGDKEPGIHYLDWSLGSIGVPHRHLLTIHLGNGAVIHVLLNKGGALPGPKEPEGGSQ